MVTICENLKAISEKLYEISHKQSLAQTWTWRDGRIHSGDRTPCCKSRCPPSPPGQGGLAGGREGDIILVQQNIQHFNVADIGQRHVYMLQYFK